MLKTTKVKVELLTDIDMVLMTEKGIRGGLTQVIRKHALANNKYLPNYDRTKKCVFTVSKCNQFIWLCYEPQRLPLDGYKWANVAIFTDHYVKNYDANEDKGSLLEVDIEYPIELRSAH